MEASYRYEYGQTVRVAAHAPQSLVPGEYVFVVGMYTVQQEQESSVTGYPIGTPLYTIEYPDGSSKVVTEEYIEEIKEGGE
jgi:hypothetical protein